jgi:hypothetical protein
MRKVWSAFVTFVDNHPKLFAFLVTILFVAVIFVSGLNQGYLKIISQKNRDALDTSHYKSSIGITLDPGIVFLYGDEYRVGGCLEIGYIAPVSFTGMASVPMFYEIESDKIAGGLGIDTQVKDNLFLGISYNKEISGKDFWAFYGKVLF